MTRRGAETKARSPGEISPELSVLNDGLPLPKMMVFDLDYTLWPFWVDTHVSGPLKGSSDGGISVQDAYRGTCRFYNDVPGILAAIKGKGIALGAASRTSAPDLARSMLTHLRIQTEDAKPMALSLFDHLEIYPGSKITHFQRLHKTSGVAFEEMLFFDDESRNKNVETLGVVMYLVRDGVSSGEFGKGIASWRKRNNRSKSET